MKKVLVLLCCVFLFACDDDSQANQKKDNSTKFFAGNTYTQNYSRGPKTTLLMENVDSTPEKIYSIIRSGIDVNEKDDMGRTVLHRLSPRTTRNSKNAN